MNPLTINLEERTKKSNNIQISFFIMYSLQKTATNCNSKLCMICKYSEFSVYMHFRFRSSNSSNNTVHWKGDYIIIL